MKKIKKRQMGYTVDLGVLCCSTAKPMFILNQRQMGYTVDLGVLCCSTAKPMFILNRGGLHLYICKISHFPK